MGIQLILIQVLTFGIIIFVLRFLFGSQLRDALRRLQELHQESLEKEEILNKEIERARTLSQTEIARSKEEARHIIDNAHRNAERLAEDARNQAQIQVRKMVAEAAERVKTLEAEAVATAEEKALDVAQQLVAEVFTGRGHAALHRELVGEFLDELERVESERLRVATDGDIQVSVARLLAEDQRKRLEAILAEKRGGATPLREIEDPGLITGIILNLGGLVIDGSLKNRMKKVLNARRRRQAEA